MIPQTINPRGNPCDLATKWGISLELADKLTELAGSFHPISVQIISGYRSPERQLELEREGRPTAPVDRSTHTTCPATGADLAILGGTTDVKLELLRRAHDVGLRVGGGGPTDDNGIPVDWNHVDLGPRRP